MSNVADQEHYLVTDSAPHRQGAIVEPLTRSLEIVVGDEDAEPALCADATTHPRLNRFANAHDDRQVGYDMLFQI